MKEYNGNYMAFGPRPDLEPNQQKEKQMYNKVRDMNVKVNLSDLFFNNQNTNYNALNFAIAQRDDMIVALEKDAQEFIDLYGIQDVTVEELAHDFMDRR